MFKSNPGIYQIRCLVNNKVYIGSTCNLSHRISMHKYELKSNQHGNRFLQNAWNKYGKSAFIFSVLEYCKRDEVLSKELSWFKVKNCCSREFGFNIQRVPNSGPSLYGEANGMYGRTHTDEVKKKLSKLATQRTGSKNPNYGNGNKIRGDKNPFYGKSHSMESRKKMSKNSRTRKLMDSQVAHIKYLFSENHSRDRICQLYPQVTRTTINRILSNKTRGHILPKQKVFGIDLDGCCFEFVDPFRLWLNDKLDMDIEAEEITSYYWHESTDVTKQQFDYEFDRFGIEAHGYRHLEVLPGTLEALQAIIDAGHEIVYITSRPEYTRQDTIDSLEEHNFPRRENLYFAKGSKTSLMKQYNVDVFIDDSPSTIEEITANTRATIYCRSYKYNEHLSDRYFTRVNSWEEFLEAEELSARV